MFFIIEEAKETVLDVSQETVKVLWMQSIFLIFINMKMTQYDSLNVNYQIHSLINLRQQ